MRYLPALCLMLAALTWGQQEHVVEPSHAARQSQTQVPRDDDDQSGLPSSSSAVAPDAAVITIHGLCHKPVSAMSGKTAAASCQTLITRAQFEKLSSAVLPKPKPSLERELAHSYPNVLAMAQASEARGLENSPRVQERLAFARLQILAQELVRQIDEESSQISDKEVDDYYHSHAADFQTVGLERIFVPNLNNTDATISDAQHKKSEEAMSRVAEQLHERAVSGEDFFVLQKQAYEEAGMTDVPPSASLGQVRVAELPAGHSLVADLKPGEISPILSDSTGHYIYKLDSKNIDESDQTKEEIRRLLKKQHKEKAMQSVQQPITTELNPVYFGSDASSRATAPK